MYVYVLVYISICVCLCVHVYVYVCHGVHISVYTYALMYMCHVRVSIFMCVFMYVRVSVNILPVCCLCQYVHACLYFCVSVCIYVCIGVYVCVSICASVCAYTSLCVCVCEHALSCDSLKQILSGEHPNSPRSRLLWSLSLTLWIVEGIGTHFLWTVSGSILYVPPAQKTLGSTHRCGERKKKQMRPTPLYSVCAWFHIGIVTDPKYTQLA